MSKRVYVNPHNDENFLILSANYLKYFFLCNCLQQQAAEFWCITVWILSIVAIFRPLALLWRGLRTRKLITKGLWIFIDEFQNLSLKEDSVLLEMLCEARSIMWILCWLLSQSLDTETISKQHWIKRSPFVTASTFPPYFLIRAESYTVRCQW